MLMSHYLSVVSRLLLISEPVFQLGLSECLASSEGKSSSEVEVLGLLTDVMASRVSYISQPERRKLICIALLKLLSTADPVRNPVVLHYNTIPFHLIPCRGVILCDSHYFRLSCIGHADYF
jgi:hypothetical protein